MDEIIKQIFKKNQLLGLILAVAATVTFFIELIDKFTKLWETNISFWWQPCFLFLSALIGIGISNDKQGFYTIRERKLAKLLVITCCQLSILLIWFYFDKDIYNGKKLQWGLMTLLVSGTGILLFTKLFQKTKKYKILFCEFSEAANEKKPQDRHITYYVFNELQKRFSGTNVLMEKIDEVVIDDSRAQTLGTNTDAIAIIYGIYTKVHSNIKLDLRFLVIRTPEYYQPIDLNKKILPMEDLDAGKLEALIGNNYANITNFLVGLFEYSRSKYNEAISSFTNLIVDTNKNNTFNSVQLDVVYLYLGNSFFYQMILIRANIIMKWPCQSIPTVQRLYTILVLLNSKQGI